MKYLIVLRTHRRGCVADQFNGLDFSETLIVLRKKIKENSTHFLGLTKTVSTASDLVLPYRDMYRQKLLL